MLKSPALGLAAALLATAPVLGQSTPPQQKPAAADSNATKVEVGFEERVRSESLNNNFDFNDATDDHRLWYRFRSRLWGKATFGSLGELAVTLNNESRKTVLPDTPFVWDEVVFETLYADWKIQPNASLKVGRQNIMKGDGFVLFDGTSGDGSRTAYFNAVVASFGWSRSKVEAIVIDDPHTDYFLVFNDKSKLLQEWDEQAYGFYYTGRELPKTAIDAYALVKSERHDTRAVTNPQFQADRQLFTLGGRVVQDLGAGFALSAEAAGQWGTEKPKPGVGGDDKDIAAWGGQAIVKKTFDAPGKPSLSLGYIAMSGDDPATAKNEGWDPLFSRWPKWSELYIYSLVPEKGVAYWTNNGMLQAELLVNPTKWLGLRATYYHMTAFHPFPGNPKVFGTGKTRGDLYEGRADVTFSQSLKGHALVEYLAPGNFYSGPDAAYFVRFELSYTFKHLF